MKYIKYPLLILFVISFAFAGEKTELGKRYIKLGNTYREAGNYSNAAEYLKKGTKLIEQDNSWEAKYWLAAAHEFYAYFYRDMNMSEEAKKEFTIAQTKYNELISMKGGSDEAIKEARLNLNKINDIIAGESYNYDPDIKIASYDDMNLRNAPGNIPVNVENLSLKDNKIRDFDYILLNLKQLKFLDLSDNKLRELPSAEMLKKLDKLVWLDLSNNKLKRADISSLCALQNLAVLDLTGNDIEFNQIRNLIQCLPNTRIIHDKYELAE